MKDLISDLSKCVSDLSEIVEISSKGGRYSENYVYKKIEDGILDNIHNASDGQLNVIMTSYRFRYYTEFSNKEILKNEINKRLRDKKIGSILD